MIVPGKRNKDFYCYITPGDVFQFLDEPENYYIEISISQISNPVGVYVNLATGEGFVSDDKKDSHRQIEILRNAELIIDREEF